LQAAEPTASAARSVVPVSGGGMLSGIAVAAKALKPGILIVAAEPSGANNAADAAASLAAGRLIQDMPKPVTIADGLQGEREHARAQGSGA
jgi:serine racemase